MFYHLEGSNEIRAREFLAQKRAKELERLRNETQDFIRQALEATGPEDTWPLVHRLSQLLFDSMLAQSSLGISARDVVAMDIDFDKGRNEQQLNWSFASSLLFAFTAVTTIGKDFFQEWRLCQFRFPCLISADVTTG